MGSYTFKWEHPEASQVYVTGTFDDWGKTEKLDRQENGFFSKTVKLPRIEKTLYKFVVNDNNWTTNSHLPLEYDEHGNQNNVLQADQIIPEPEPQQEPEVAAISSAAPTATTAVLAGEVPKEGEKAADVVPGAFPETPAGEPAAFAVNPLPMSEGPGNPIQLAPGEPVPDSSTMTSHTVASTVHDDPELVAADKAAQEAAEGDQVVSVGPIPASDGIGNPISLAPGEPVPDPSTITSHTVASTVKHDEASYNASDAAVSVPPTTTEAEVNPAETGVFGVPPAGATFIPESSLPVGNGAGISGTDAALGAGILTSSAAVGATTAALAGQVPIEERGVPEIVKESQAEAGFAPEASANSEAVEEKKELEAELKDKVPEEAPTSEGSATEAGAATTSETVPEIVQESIAESGQSPEAAANPVAVEEKSAVEKELESKVEPVEAAGEPAPTVAAATTEAAPEPTPATTDDAPPTTPPKSETEPASGTPASVDGSSASPANGKTSKKGKRKSILFKLKHIFD